MLLNMHIHINVCIILQSRRGEAHLNLIFHLHIIFLQKKTSFTFTLICNKLHSHIIFARLAFCGNNKILYTLSAFVKYFEPKRREAMCLSGV